MILLPSEQKERVKKAIKEFEKLGELSILEPCDCGSHIRHNNGGNYHQLVFLKKDSGKNYVKMDTTCELDADAEWEECNDIEHIIRENADWL